MERLFEDINDFRNDIDKVGFYFANRYKYLDDVQTNGDEPFSLKTNFDRRIRTRVGDAYFIPSAKIEAVHGNNAPNNVNVWFRMLPRHFWKEDSIQSAKCSLDAFNLAVSYFESLYTKGEHHREPLSGTQLLSSHTIGINNVDEFYTLLENVVQSCQVNAR